MTYPISESSTGLSALNAKRDQRLIAQNATITVGLLFVSLMNLNAQSYTFAGNAQHTAQFPVRAQHMNRVLWSASVDVTYSASSSHYGAPLITASNTIIVPTVINGSVGDISSVRYSIKAYEGGTGRLKYTLTNDYKPPALPLSPGQWWPVYQPVLVSLPG